VAGQRRFFAACADIFVDSRKANFSKEVPISQSISGRFELAPEARETCAETTKPRQGRGFFLK